MRYFWLLSFLLFVPRALADGFPSGQQPPGSPSQGIVLQLLVGGVAKPVSSSNPLPITGGTPPAGVLITDDANTVMITDDANTVLIGPP